MKTTRRFPVGAEVVAGSVHFRIWAPDAETPEVVIKNGQEDAGRAVGMRSVGNGYYEASLPGGAGMRYEFRLREGGPLLSDPASRFQPAGPHGPSQVVDPGGFEWTDAGWAGLTRHRQVIYEMHIGTFTPEGTWEAAIRQLPELSRLGVSVLEVLPVAEFAGDFGWGYDGVNLFAPYHLYGNPDGFRSFVDKAHALGLGVILDVVYNHLGPDGNVLLEFARSYFTDRYSNDWGEAVNFDGPGAGPVREYFIANAGYWIDEFHLDGYRIDATQQIFDASPRHIVQDIVEESRRRAGGRGLLIIAENEPQDTLMVRAPTEGGFGLDALWNDDFHHMAMVALTSRNDAYYTDYLGSPQEFISTCKWGFLYQGQRYKWQKQRRGTPALDLPPTAFVNYIQNHDQVANSARGERCHRLTNPARLRAITAVLLLAPGTPMIFQGQEFAASTPFLYFADHNEGLRKAVAEGRRKFLGQFRTLAQPETQGILPDPADHATFDRCKLDFSTRERHAGVYRLHRDLLALRKGDPCFANPRPRSVDGAVLAPDALVLRFFGESTSEDRLLLVNLGRDLNLDPAPEPLLAPPRNRKWGLLWSSEDPEYGGTGTPPLETDDNWRLPGNAAVVLTPQPCP